MKWILLLALSGSALAHDTKSAGAVQVTLLTDADDGLRVTGDTRVTLAFRHTGSPLKACACRVLLYRGAPSARVPPLQDVRLTDLRGGEGVLTLSPVPAGAYTLVLVGRPAQFGDFDAFKMQYVLQATPP